MTPQEIRNENVDDAALPAYAVLVSLILRHSNNFEDAMKGVEGVKKDLTLFFRDHYGRPLQ